MQQCIFCNHQKSRTFIIYKYYRARKDCHSSSKNFFQSCTYSVYLGMFTSSRARRFLRGIASLSWKPIDFLHCFCPMPKFIFLPIFIGDESWPLEEKFRNPEMDLFWRIDKHTKDIRHKRLQSFCLWTSEATVHAITSTKTFSYFKLFLINVDGMQDLQHHCKIEPSQFSAEESIKERRGRSAQLCRRNSPEKIYRSPYCCEFRKLKD